MTTITLTTDFGLRDHYSALLKGTLLQRQPDLRLVDITHQIRTYDIVQAAFLFGSAWQYFPKGSIHIISVNDQAPSNPEFILVEDSGHFFLGPNNGLFGLIFGRKPEKAWQLPEFKQQGFYQAHLLAQAVEQICEMGKPESWAQPLELLVERITLQPVIGPDQIKGMVIHIDGYENVICNVRKELFERVGQERPFAIYFKRHDPIKRMHHHYSEVEVGQPLCFFNAAGFLEIAINLGKAATLLGLNEEDTIQIEFFDHD